MAARPKLGWVACVLVVVAVGRAGAAKRDAATLPKGTKPLESWAMELELERLKGKLPKLQERVKDLEAQNGVGKPALAAVASPSSARAFASRGRRSRKPATARWSTNG